VAAQPETEIPGCGGFVEASPALAKLRKSSDPKLDYSSIKVELTTLEGLRKYQTECAPSGYYFIPASQPGTYVLKVSGPDGWAFEPSEATVEVDANGQCSGGEDVDFQYTGFSISGVVLGQASAGCAVEETAGPAGVTVSLTPAGGTRQQTQTTVSGPGGVYTFSNLPAGVFELRASHAVWSISEDPVSVALDWTGLVTHSAALQVRGYDVSGSVLSEGSPVTDVQVLLFSDTVTADQVACSPGSSANAAKTSGALCSAVTDASGRFSFPSCACGTYSLVPKYSGGGKVFDVAPATMQVAVGHGSEEVKTAFQITGFSISGRVVDAVGAGVAAAMVHVDAVHKATSDASGAYRLNSVRPGSYTLTATDAKGDVAFRPLKALAVKPNMAALPDIVASEVSVCGQVFVSDKKFSVRGRTVTLTAQKGGAKTTRKADAEGKFRFMAAPGDYKMAVLTTDKERAGGLWFGPEEATFTIGPAPIEGITFSQAQVGVSGKVKCVTASCPAGLVSVSLRPVESVKGGSLKALADAEGRFAFEKLNPGKYVAEVHRSQWCWKKSEVAVTVGVSDVTDVVFEQQGYFLAVDATHAAEATVTHDTSAKTMKVSLPVGTSQHCLADAGLYTLVPSGCFKFLQKSYAWSTADAKVVKLVATSTQMVGTVKVKGTSKAQAIKVSVVKEGSDDSPTLVEATPLKKDPTTLTYSLWVNFGDRLLVTPLAPDLLFYPPSAPAFVPQQCRAPGPSFEGKEGVYASGSVGPAIAGAAVTVTVKGTGAVLETVTDANGKYTLGPFYDDAKYDIEVSKVGYAFEPNPQKKTQFTTRKLSQISVTTTVGGKVVGGVLLSLSGNDRPNRGYRKNAATSEVGSLLFPALSPGSFYVRPLLKEYSFQPASFEILIAEGEHREIAFEGTRVAFSALGHVASLNGIPEAGVVVEGVSVDGKHLEETVTESDGSFRLQGLKPKTTYTVRLRSTPAGDLAIMETASPVSVAVTMGAEDAEGLYFVMFRSPASGSISGIIEADVKHLSTLTVALSSAVTPEVTERSLPVSFARSFEFHGLKPGAYVIRLRSSLSAHTYHIPDVHSRWFSTAPMPVHPRLPFPRSRSTRPAGRGPTPSRPRSCRSRSQSSP